MTPKQELFAQAYIETGNASEAYKRAYDTQANANTICSGLHLKMLRTAFNAL